MIDASTNIPYDARMNHLVEWLHDILPDVAAQRVYEARIILCGLSLTVTRHPRHAGS